MQNIIDINALLAQGKVVTTLDSSDWFIVSKTDPSFSTPGNSGGFPLFAISKNNLAAALGGGSISGGVNVGAGSQVFKDVSGTNLRFRSIVAGANIIITQNANDITISGASGMVTGTGTTNVGVQWTNGPGGVIGDGTWGYSGNTWYPLNAGSDIGDNTHRLGTIFMGTAFDYNSTLNWVNSASTKMTLTTGGNLGIGTTAPVTKLTVSANDQTANIISIRYESAVSAPAGYAGLRARGTQSGPSALLANDEISSHAAIGCDSVGFTNVTGASIFVAAENFTPTAQGTYWKVGTTALGTTAKIDRLFVTSEGNLGIGTSAPSFKTEVVGSSGGTIGLEVINTDNTGVSSFLLGEAGGGSFNFYIQRNGSASTPGTERGVEIMNTDASYIFLGTNGNERLRILSTGEVGVNISAPTAKLHVVGATADQFFYGLKVADSNNSPILGVRNDGITTAYGSLEVGGGIVNGFPFSLAAGRFAQVLQPYGFSIGAYAQANGSHCIAIMNASTTGYESFAAGNVTANGTHSFAFGNGITVTGQGSIGFGMNDISSSGTLSQNYTTSFMGGIVGIGTLTPTAKLHVVGDDATAGNYAFKSQNNTPTDLFTVRNDGTIAMPLLQVGNVGLASGELYVDTAANILVNGDLIVARKV